MPSPLDIPPVEGEDPDKPEQEARRARPIATGPFAALAFKIINDPFVGQLTFLRVYSGRLESGTAVLNSTKGKRERVGRLLQMHANKRDEIKVVEAGDIAAAVGLRTATTGDTLCDEKHAIVLERMVFPEPVISIAIEPQDQERPAASWATSLQKLTTEDPSFRVKTDEETGQTIIAGMGELHLEIIVDRLRREFKVECNVGTPAGRLPRVDQQAGQGRGQVHQAVGRPRHVRPRLARDRPRRARQRLRVREQDRRRRDPEGVHPFDREGRSRRHGPRRARRLSRSST